MMTLIISAKSRHIISSRRRRAACHWSPASFPYMSKGVMQVLSSFMHASLHPSGSSGLVFFFACIICLVLFFLFSSCVIKQNVVVYCFFFLSHVLSYQIAFVRTQSFHIHLCLTKISIAALMDHHHYQHHHHYYHTPPSPLRALSGD
jgi:hypothetical protein